MSNKQYCKCGVMVIGPGACDDCKPRRTPSIKEAEGLTTTQRGYGWDWRQLSERFRGEHPLCHDCGLIGIVQPSTSVHHCKPLATHPELRLEWSNLVALCESCHKIRDQSDDPQRPATGVG